MMSNKKYTDKDWFVFRQYQVLCEQIVNGYDPNEKYMTADNAMQSEINQINNELTALRKKRDVVYREKNRWDEGSYEHRKLTDNLHEIRLTVKALKARLKQYEIDPEKEKPTC